MGRAAPPTAVPRRDEPLLRRPQREQARRHARPRGAGRPRAPAGAARVGGRVDRDDAAGHAGCAGARPRRSAGPQPGARDYVDHRLRPDRRLPRLAGNDTIHAAMSGILSRSGLAGREPLPAPRGMAYETTAIQAAWATLVAYWNRLETGRGDHVDFSILEAATQTMDPAHGTASVSRASAFPSTRGGPRPGSVRSSCARTATCASSSWPRASGGRCGRGSASPRPSRTSGTTRSWRGSRRPPSSRSSTRRCSPA